MNTTEKIKRIIFWIFLLTAVMTGALFATLLID